MGIRCADHVTPLYPQKLALTSPTGGGRSVGIVRSRTKATGFSLGASVQSTTGIRGVRINGSNAGYAIFRGSVKSTGYPVYSPVSHSLALSCVTVCHHVSTGLYIPFSSAMTVYPSALKKELCKTASLNNQRIVWRKKNLEAFRRGYFLLPAQAVTCHVVATFRLFAMQNKIECWSQK